MLGHRNLGPAEQVLTRASKSLEQTARTGGRLGASKRRSGKTAVPTSRKAARIRRLPSQRAKK